MFALGPRHGELRGRARDPATAALAQGLFVHEARSGLYGLTPAGAADRRTLPVAQRLADAGPEPLTVPRPPGRRARVTCRDFALLAAALLRAGGWSARVRCGFAAYFAPGRWEDHWLCEYRWHPEDRRRRLDAQLDPAHVADLGIGFDPAHVPDDAFLCGDRAWRDWRAGRVAADRFGHGDDRGEWFLWVNLNRDALSVSDRITSPWDGWRERRQALPPVDLDEGDALAAEIQRLAG